MRATPGERRASEGTYPLKRRRPYLINGRLRVPFEGYQRPSATTELRAAVAGPVSVFQWLTSEQAWQALQRLSLAIRRRRQQGRPC